MKPEELLKIYKPFQSRSRNKNQGRKVVKVMGNNYGLIGVFMKEFLGNMTSPHVVRIEYMAQL
jgi:hypothetical protein